MRPVLPPGWQEGVLGMRRLILGMGVLALGACGGSGGYEKPTNLCEASKDQKSVRWTDFPEKALSVSERLAREIAKIAMGAATAVAFSTFI